MSEVWARHPMYNGYDVSDVGGVRSWRKRGKGRGFKDKPVTLIQHKCSGGRPQVVVAGEQRKVGHLVLEAFVGPRPSPRHVCCHNDGNPGNNRLDNLRWDTGSANYADRRIHGTCNSARGRGVPRKRMAPAERINAMILIALGATQRDCAEWFGKSEVCISLMRKRLSILQ